MINLIALDMLMSIGFFAIFSIFGSLNYSEVFSLVPYLNEVAITIIALLLLGGALAKSANIPLHSWLPLSMEASHNYNYINFALAFDLACALACALALAFALAFIFLISIYFTKFVIFI
jgi:hypothetical protein